MITTIDIVNDGVNKAVVIVKKHGSVVPFIVYVDIPERNTISSGNFKYISVISKDLDLTGSKIDVNQIYDKCIDHMKKHGEVGQMIVVSTTKVFINDVYHSDAIVCNVCGTDVYYMQKYMIDISSGAYREIGPFMRMG